MKHPISPAAVAAIATAAFLAHNPDYREEPDAEHPERVAEDLLGLNDLAESLDKEAFDAVVQVYDRVLAFGLQTGALIGANPLHVPDLKDLIAQYRLKPKARAA